MNFKKYIPLIIGIVLFVIVFFVIDYKKALELLKRTNLVFALIILVLIFAVYVIQTLRFSFLYRTVHKKVKGFWKIFQIVSSATIVNFTSPGSGGDVITRPYLMKKLMKMDMKHSFVAVATERIYDVLLIITAALVTSIVIFPQVAMQLSLLLVALIILIIIFFSVPASKWPKRTPKLIMQVIRALHDIKKIPFYAHLLVFVLTLVNWAVVFFSLTLCAMAIGGSFKAIMPASFIIMTAIGIVTLIPGVLGTQEISISALFTHFNIVPELGFGSVLLYRILTIVFGFAVCSALLGKLK